MLTCPYCKKISSDMQFCSNCGKEISSKRKDKVIEHSFINDLKSRTDIWKNGYYPVDVAWSGYEPKDSWFAHSLPTALVEIPFYRLNENNIWYLFFHKSEEKPLSEHLKSLEKATPDERFEEAVNIVRMVSKFSMKLNEKNYALGCISLENFWIGDIHSDTVRLRQIEPLFAFGQTGQSRAMKDYYSPEAINVQGKIGSQTDVFAIGNVFMGIVMNRQQFIDFSELFYIAHQFRFFMPEAPIEIHSWLNKTVCLEPTLRFKSPSEQLESLDKVFNRNRQRQSVVPSLNVEIGYGIYTDPGTGKLKDEDDFRLMEEVNEDRYFFAYHPDGNHIALGIVADGISKCSYGKGSEAAQIVIDTAREVWQNNGIYIQGIEDAKEVVRELIEKANDNVVRAAVKYIPVTENEEPEHILVKSGELMASTFAICLLYGNQALFASLGDSRMYVYSPIDGLMLLTPDHNLKNEWLLNGKDWRQINSNENASAITRYIGQIEENTWPLKAKTPEPFIMTSFIRPDETILMCSDGVTDYAAKSSATKGEWESDRSLSRLMEINSEKTKSVKRLSRKIADEANQNGGGDNITILMLKIKEQQPVQQHPVIAESGKKEQYRHINSTTSFKKDKERGHYGK